MDKEVKNSERNREDNLKPFKPGESGNPNGRPLGQRNYATIYREALLKLAKINDKTPEELEEEILSKGLLSARSGDYRFYKDIQDRLHGTATIKSESEVKVTGTINTQDPKMLQIAQKYEEELTNARIEKLINEPIIPS